MVEVVNCATPACSVPDPATLPLTRNCTVSPSGGGPAIATQLFATYAYQLGIGTGLLSQGAAISLAIFPILLLVVIVQLVYIRRAETL